jgi:hypothetical protein
MNVDAAAIANDPRLSRWLSERSHVVTTRFATCDELLCSACLHTTARAEHEDDLEAFVRLWLRERLIAEELEAMEAQFFLASIVPGPYAPLSEAEWNAETSLHVNGILASDRLVGIFVDGVRVDEATYRFALPGRFETAVAIRKVWNDVAMLARTSDAYALFTWATSA